MAQRRRSDHLTALDVGRAEAVGDKDDLAALDEAAFKSVGVAVQDWAIANVPAERLRS